MSPSRLPRLIATDLDGTLVGADYVISQRTATALRAASAAGTVVVLVTGRPVRWLSLVYGQLGVPYMAVCANGAVVYDPAEDVVRWSSEIPADVLAEACRRIRADVDGATFAVEVDGGRRMLHEPAYPLIWDAEDPAVRVVPLTVLISAPAVKLLVRAPDRNPDELTAEVAASVGTMLEATHSSFGGLVELSRRGVTKATGLAAFAATIGLSGADGLAGADGFSGADHAIVFGDMPNDLTMFAWARGGIGSCAVAVANAHPAVLAAASDLTLSNVDDGVADFLERRYALAGR